MPCARPALLFQLAVENRIWVFVTRLFKVIYQNYILSIQTFTLGAAKVVVWVTVNQSYDVGRFVKRTKQALAYPRRDKFSLIKNKNKRTSFTYTNTVKPSQALSQRCANLSRNLYNRLQYLRMLGEKQSSPGSLLARFGLEDTQVCARHYGSTKGRSIYSPKHIGEATKHAKCFRDARLATKGIVFAVVHPFFSYD